MAPEITVLLPVYNGERFLRETIESVLRSSFTNFEFLIILDGCTDGSEEIISSYLNDPRIEVHSRKKNRGLVYTLNEGLKLSNANYVARIDADDLMHADRLGMQLQYMKEHNLDLCGSFCIFINENSNIIKTRIYPPNHSACIATLLHGVPFGHGSVMFKRAKLRQHQLSYKNVPCEDYKLWIDCAFAGLKFGNVPNFFFMRRIVSESLSSTKRQEMKLNSRQLSKMYRKNVNIVQLTSDWLKYDLSYDDCIIFMKVVSEIFVSDPFTALKLLHSFRESHGWKVLFRCLLRSL